MPLRVLQIPKICLGRKNQLLNPDYGKSVVSFCPGCQQKPGAQVQ